MNNFIKQLTKERDGWRNEARIWKAQCDRLEAKCAEMRQRIADAHDRLLRGVDDTEILELLQESRGEPTSDGFIHVSELQKTMQFLRQLTKLPVQATAELDRLEKLMEGE